MQSHHSQVQWLKCDSDEFYESIVANLTINEDIHVESLAKFQKVSLYLSTLASSTPILLFSQMLKFSKIISSKSKKKLWRKIMNV
jgi:hypothetical protein